MAERDGIAEAFKVKIKWNGLEDEIDLPLYNNDYRYVMIYR